MTGEEFTARYRLTRQLADGDVASYAAADARKHSVYVHVFRGEDAPDFDVSSLEPTAAALVREEFEVEGLRVIVTDPIEGFSDFESWVEASRSEEGEPGAYTRIFGAISLPDASEDSPAATPDRSSPDEPAPTEADEPGEYTRIFGAPAAGTNPAAGADTPAADRAPGQPFRPPRVDDPATEEPAPAPPEPTFPDAPLEDSDDPSSVEPSEKAPPPLPDPFGGSGAPTQSPSPSNDPPRNPPADESGVFTRIMGRPEVPDDPPRHAPLTPPKRPGELDQRDFRVSDTYLDALGESGSGESTSDPTPQRRSPLPDRPSVPSGPSEFTRVIRGASLPRPGSRAADFGAADQAPPAPDPAAKPPKRASRTPIIILLVVVGAALLAFLGYAFFRSPQG